MINSNKEMIKDFLNILFNNINKNRDGKVITLYGSILKKFFEKYLPREDISILNIYDLTNNFINQYKDIFQMYGIYTDQIAGSENIYYQDKIVIIDHHK
jgi:hypothetical protein